MKGRNKCERKRECQEKCNSYILQKLSLLMGQSSQKLLRRRLQKFYSGAYFSSKKFYTLARKLYLRRSPQKYYHFARIIVCFRGFFSKNFIKSKSLINNLIV